MNDEPLDVELREHYGDQKLDPARRDAMIRQARKHGSRWTAERILLGLAVAAVLIFAAQAALVPARFAAEGKNIAGASAGVAVEQQTPADPEVQVQRAEMRLITNDAGTVSCGGDEMPFNRAMTLTFNPDELPITCLVTIDDKRGVFHTMGTSTMTCNVEGSRVACTESVMFQNGRGKVLADPASGDGEEPTLQDKELLKETVQKYAGQLQYCYEKQLKDDPALAGRVEVAWTVSDSEASDVRVISDTVGSPGLTDCIETKVRRWQFPEGIEGDVSWPFVFQSSR